jgi:hypothetical protein
MVNKKKRATVKSENELYILPSPNEEMRTFVNKFKIDMMEHIINSIKYAIDNRLPIIEVFQFKNSPFVITIAEKEFSLNLEHIHKFLMDNEIYELCKNIEKLQKILRNNTDEKEK